MTARKLHRRLAILLGLFIALHLANHLMGLLGQETHRMVQNALRPIYRHPIIEALLLAAFAAQAVLGLTLTLRHRRLTLQTTSGLYLALFLLIHISAVLLARAQGTDTTLAFAAAGLHAPAPWPQLFAAYYALAVLALFAHLSVPLGRRFGPIATRTAFATGAVLAVTLTLLLMGRLTPLVIPPALIAAFP